MKHGKGRESMKSLYIAGIALVSLLLVSLCIWFGISMHNWYLTHQKPTQCHKQGIKISSGNYKAALAGFSKYSMYVKLTMEDNVTDNMQFGQMDVCFCGIDGKPHQAKNSVPTTYHLDTCFMTIDLGDPNIQNAFKAAYGKVAELQAFTYNADNNTFNIIAKALGSILYDVTMSPTSESLCQSCRSDINPSSAIHI